MSQGRGTGARLMMLLAWACRVLLGATFVIAGARKAVGHPAFVSDVLGFGLVFGWLAVGIAFLIPWVEIITGAAILFRRGYSGAVLLSGALLAMFTVAILQAWARGLHVACACFGSQGGGPEYGAWIARDVGLLLAAAMCAIDAARGHTLPARTDPPNGG